MLTVFFPSLRKWQSERKVFLKEILFCRVTTVGAARSWLTEAEWLYGRLDMADGHGCHRTLAALLLPPFA